MLKTYAKGARAERELAKKLMDLGFSVVRSGKSGSSISVPDIIALKRGIILAFECKSWKNVPKLRKEQYEKFLEWCEKAGAIGFLAWRKKRWFFLNVKNLKEGNIKNDGMTLKSLMLAVNV